MLGIILCEFLCSGSIDEFIKKRNYITKSFYNVHCLFTVFFCFIATGWVDHITLCSLQSSARDHQSVN